MPSVNLVAFKFDAETGELEVDSFRMMFNTDRIGDCKRALERLTDEFGHSGTVYGDIRFVDADGPRHTPEINFDTKDGDGLHRVKLPYND